jgi:hypothetical protein
MLNTPQLRSRARKLEERPLYGENTTIVNGDSEVSTNQLQNNRVSY